MGRLRKKPWAEDALKSFDNFISEPKKFKTNWNSKVFKNDNQLQIEIGMGRGKFIIENAKLNPNINFIGIERYATVQITNLKLIKELDLKNLKYISENAENISDWFNNDSIDKIFINFPDPWPKERHSKRRLLYRNNLLNYYQILKKGSWIEFKTDQIDLFNFAIEEAKNFTKFKLKNQNNDLHSDQNLKIIKTEYEEKFISLKKPIYYIEFHK